MVKSTRSSRMSSARVYRMVQLDGGVRTTRGGWACIGFERCRVAEHGDADDDPERSIAKNPRRDKEKVTARTVGAPSLAKARAWKRGDRKPAVSKKNNRNRMGRVGAPLQADRARRARYGYGVKKRGISLCDSELEALACLRGRRDGGNSRGW